MPFSRKSLTELRAETLSDIDGSLPGAQSLLRYSNLNILGQVTAGAVHGLYGYIDYIAKQAVPFTATDEYMIAWAALKGVFQKMGGAAHGPVPLSGAPGALVLEGARFARADGETYSLAADVTLDSGGAGVGQLVADEPGTTGNCPVGTILVLTSPIAGVGSTVTLTDPIDGAVDVESLETVRTRMLEAYASPPGAGSEPDYIRWAKQVPAVTRAWCKRNGMGAGTVLVWVMLDIARAGDGGFPDGTDGVAADEDRAAAATGDQLVVADHIFEIQPTPALVFIAAPLQNTVDFTIAGLAGATTATRDLIAAAIDEVFLDRGKPGGLPDSLLELSYIEGAIAAIPAAAGFVITVITASHGSVSPGSNGNITSSAGRLPVRGDVVYV